MIYLWLHCPWLTKTRFLMAISLSYLNSHVQYLSKSFIITHCSAQKRSNKGLCLCRIVSTFMMSVRELGSKCWILALGLCRNLNGLYIIICSSTEQGSTSDSSAASDPLGDGWKSCWLSCFVCVVSRALPAHAVVWRKRWCCGEAVQGDRLSCRQRAQQLQTRQRPWALHLPPSQACTDLALSWVSPGPWSALCNPVCFILASNSASA